MSIVAAAPANPTAAAAERPRDGAPLALVALLAVDGCWSNREEKTPMQATEPRRYLDALRRYLTLPAGVERAE